MNKTPFFKIIALNLSLLIIGIVVLELFFGGWFIATSKLDLLGIPRNQYLSIEHEYYPNTGKTSYTRDQYGIRGQSVLNQPEKIDILTVGGSTTDQLYIDDSQTWQQHLQRLLHANSKPLNIGNAGINGQSTHGHIKSFEHWFPQIKELSPNYIIFYLGINDYFAPHPNFYDFDVNKDKTRVIDNSALYSIYRKLKGMLDSKKSNLTHRKVSFSDYRYDALERQVSHREQEYIEMSVEPFRQRLERLIKLCSKINAEPIFVTQPTAYFWVRNEEVKGVESRAFSRRVLANGVDYHYHLNLLNTVMRELSQNRYLTIELTNLEIWNENDFYDWLHMTPQGTEKVAKLIFKQLKDHLE